MRKHEEKLQLTEKFYIHHQTKVSFTVNGARINRVSEFKYLGRILEGYWKDIGRILEGYWRNLMTILPLPIDSSIEPERGGVA